MVTRVGTALGKRGEGLGEGAGEGWWLAPAPLGKAEDLGFGEGAGLGETFRLGLGAITAVASGPAGHQRGARAEAKISTMVAIRAMLISRIRWWRIRLPNQGEK